MSYARTHESINTAGRPLKPAHELFHHGLDFVSWRCLIMHNFFPNGSRYNFHRASTPISCYYLSQT